MKKFIFLLGTVFLICVSCNQSNKQGSSGEESTLKESSEHVETQQDDQHKVVHWSHKKGEEGPENWKNLCDEFSDCGGQAQSPININTKSIKIGNDLAKPEFHYGQTKTNIINNGHTIQFNVDEGNTVTLNGKDYELLQFHYHALSEHTVDGNYAPIEVHFVNKHSDNEYAVIGALFTEGKENELFKKYLDKFPVEKGEYLTDDMISILDVLPKNKSYYHYSGSLTTPPCSEIVEWYVLKYPIEASKEQIEKFSKILNNNYRPIQELNGREVELYQE